MKTDQRLLLSHVKKMSLLIMVFFLNKNEEKKRLLYLKSDLPYSTAAHKYPHHELFKFTFTLSLDFILPDKLVKAKDTALIAKATRSFAYVLSRRITCLALGFLALNSVI